MYCGCGGCVDYDACTVVCVRGVGGVCEMCVCLSRVGWEVWG